jgi:hypothetical protein
MMPEIYCATDLLTLPDELKRKIKNVCKNPTDKDLMSLVEELEIKSLLPEGREVETFTIWLKATGFMKIEKPDDNNVPIYAWVDMQAETILKYKDIGPLPEEEIKDIVSALESRVATITEMFLKSNGLLEKITAGRDNLKNE